MEDRVRSCGRTAGQRRLTEHDQNTYATPNLRTRERRSDWEKTCVGGELLPQGIHYPLISLGKMPCNRGDETRASLIKK